MSELGHEYGKSPKKNLPREAFTPDQILEALTYCFKLEDSHELDLLVLKVKTAVREFYIGRQTADELNVIYGVFKEMGTKLAESKAKQ
jgi:hypothetical protein